MDLRLEESLIRVDVSDPCEHGLVEDGDLDRPGCSMETLQELLTVDLVGFWTQSGQQPVLEIGVTGGDVDASEAASIDELHSDPSTLAGPEHPNNVTVWRCRSRPVGLQIDTAGHSKPD